MDDCGVQFSSGCGTGLFRRKCGGRIFPGKQGNPGTDESSAGMILVALFEIISKNTNTIKLFGRIIIAACFTAAHFVYTYVTGDYVSLRNYHRIPLRAKRALLQV